MDDLNQRARRGIRVLLGRHAVRQAIAVIGGIVVARVLGPGPIGVYGIGLFVLTICSLAADLGLRTALIRQAAAPSEQQLSTAFMLHLAVAIVLAAALIATAPMIAGIYRAAAPELAWVIRILALDLCIQSWRLMSEVRLERELRYREFAVADIIGTAGNQLVAITLVLSGWGAQSLAWALLTGSFLRTALLFRASPWAVRFTWERAAARQLVRAGVPIQANQIITLAPAWVTPTLVAALIGPEAVGILNWAAGIGRKPLEVLENVVRVSAPHFARLQNDLREVERVLGRYVVVSLLACGLWFSVLVVAAPDLVALVYTERWLPAVPALLVYAGAAMISVVRWLASAALVSVGRVRYTTKVSTLGALVATAASVLLVLRVGFIGVPIGQLVSLVLVTPLFLFGLRRGMPGSILRASIPVAVPVAASVAGGALAMLLPLPSAWRGLLVAGAMTLAYAATTWWAGPAWLRASVREEWAPLARPHLQPLWRHPRS